MPLHPPKVKSFFFCMPLDLGTKIIAHIHAVSSFFTIQAFNIPNQQNGCITYTNTLSQLLFIYLALSPTIDSYKAGRIYAMHGYFMQISFTSYGIFSMALLYGAMRTNPIQMVPWILLNIIFISMVFVEMVEAVIFLAVGNPPHVSKLTYQAAIIVVQAYSAVVVYSNYLELKEQRCPSLPIRESPSA